MASSTESGMPSQLDDRTKKSAARSRAVTSSRCPRNMTPSGARLLSRASSEPDPAIHRTTSGNLFRTSWKAEFLRQHDRHRGRHRKVLRSQECHAALQRHPHCTAQMPSVSAVSRHKGPQPKQSTDQPRRQIGGRGMTVQNVGPLAAAQQEKTEKGQCKCRGSRRHSQPRGACWRTGAGNAARNSSTGRGATKEKAETFDCGATKPSGIRPAARRGSIPKAHGAAALPTSAKSGSAAGTVLQQAPGEPPAAEAPGPFIRSIPERRQLSVGSSGVPASSL